MSKSKVKCGILLYYISIKNDKIQAIFTPDNCQLIFSSALREWNAVANQA